MASKRRSLSKLARGFRDRTLVTARLASKTGFKMLAKTLNPNAKAKEVDEDKAVEAAEELLEQMSEMKGLIMKFGQMASYLEGAMPAKAQKVLAQLQAQSTPMSFEAVAVVIESELGAAPDELFEELQREPFAAASIGQVHRGRFEGRPVAIKVQYPDIDKVLKSDLRTVGTLARLSTMFTSVDGGGLVAELQERMDEECDYVREAANQRLFCRLLEPIAGASVPRVVEARSTRRVLTSELVDALSFAALCEQPDQTLRDRAASTIFEVCFNCIFQHCVFNADPHPGNYLFASDEVVFLDFGCIKRFSKPYIESWKRLALSILDGDRVVFKEASIDMGLVARERGFDWDYQWNVMRYLYEPFMNDGFRFDSEYVTRSYDLILWKNPNRYKAGMPRDTLFVNRLQWGLNSVLSQLQASGPWPELWRRAVETPTEPVDALDPED